MHTIQHSIVHCIPAVLSSAKGYRGESPREEQGKWDHDEIHKLNFHSTSTISIPLFEIDTECQMMILQTHAAHGSHDFVRMHSVTANSARATSNAHQSNFQPQHRYEERWSVSNFLTSLTPPSHRGIQVAVHDLSVEFYENLLHFHSFWITFLPLRPS